MKKKDINKITEVAESLGWSVRIDKKDCLFSKFSPAGQDFNIEFEAEDLEEVIEKIKERCVNFDCSEETSLWLDESGHGTNGAPYDMKDLYEDMDDCRDMIDELEKAIRKII